MSKKPSQKPKLRPMWKCPKCGHRFVSRNLWHSCSNYTLDHHFMRRDPTLRKTFDAWLAAVRKCGLVTVIPQKSRIVFMVRVRFAGAIIRKGWVEAGLWLRSKIKHPRLLRIAEYVPGNYFHYFQFEKPADIDRAFGPWLREAYAIGCQQRLKDRAK